LIYTSQHNEVTRKAVTSRQPALT